MIFFLLNWNSPFHAIDTQILPGYSEGFYHSLGQCVAFFESRYIRLAQTGRFISESKRIGKIYFSHNVYV